MTIAEPIFWMLLGVFVHNTALVAVAVTLHWERAFR